MAARDAGVDMLVVGPITRDVTLCVREIPPPGGSAVASRIVVAVGGKGGNPAVCAARLGARVRLVGAVGDDEAGDAALRQLTEDGIDVSLVRRCPGEATGQIVHIVEPGGRRRYLEHRGANDRVAVDSAQIAAACGPDTVVLLSTALPQPPVQAAVDGARRAGASIIADLAGEPGTSQEVLADVHVARADADEAGELTGGDVHDFASAAVAAHRLRERGPAIAVVQAGGDGDLVHDGDQEIRLPHHPVEVVDPTGGGDAFIATFAVLLARDGDLAAAARTASAAAAHTIAHLGGRPRFTGEAELRAMDTR